jgi:hypothetical protein
MEREEKKANSFFPPCPTRDRARLLLYGDSAVYYVQPHLHNGITYYIIIIIICVR